jgi:hypothetical protein
MLSVDTAFDRIASALGQRGYARVSEQKPPDSPGDRVAVFRSPDTAVRIGWKEKARLLILEIDADGGWVEFARHGFGPAGLEDTAVETMVRAIRNEVAETSTDAD